MTWWPEDQDAVRAHLRRVTLQSTDDSGPQQLLNLKGLSSEQLQKIVRIQNFGFHSNAPINTSEGLILSLGGRSDRAMALGIEDPNTRPTNRPIGSTCIYDAYGQIVSIVNQDIRITGNGTITITAPTIVLAGTVKLGGADAAKPASMQGTIDTEGNADISNLSTMVLMK